MGAGFDSRARFDRSDDMLASLRVKPKLIRHGHTIGECHPANLLPVDNRKRLDDAGAPAHHVVPRMHKAPRHRCCDWLACRITAVVQSIEIHLACVDIVGLRLVGGGTNTATDMMGLQSHARWSGIRRRFSSVLLAVTCETSTVQGAEAMTVCWTGFHASMRV